MCPLKSWILVYISAIVMKVQCSFATFEHDVNFGNNRPVSDYISETMEDNVLLCARRCSRMYDCVSFFYSESDMHCRLLDKVLDIDVYTGNLETSDRSKYYVAQHAYPASFSSSPTSTLSSEGTSGITWSTETNSSDLPSPTGMSTSYSAITSTGTETVAVEPTTTPSPVCPEFNPSNNQTCPDEIDNCRLMKLSGEDDIYIRVVSLSTGFDHPYAYSFCASMNATLPRIMNEERLQAYRILYTTCSAFNDKDFWVDGGNANAADFYAPDAYSTSYGEPIPLVTSYQLWYTDRPNYPSHEHCLHMTSSYNFFLDDGSCSRSRSFVCEKNEYF